MELTLYLINVLVSLTGSYIKCININRNQVNCIHLLIYKARSRIVRYEASTFLLLFEK